MQLLMQMVRTKLIIPAMFSKNMKNKIIRIYSLVIVSIFAILSFPVQASAVSNFPQMMYGNPSAKIGSETYYGGLGGTYAVYNPDPNSSYGFDKVKVTSGCNLYIDPASFVSCFILGTGVNGTPPTGANRMMHSQTTVDGFVAYEMPVLYFGGANIYGDVSGSLNYLKFWGKNMSRGATNSDGVSWDLGSYAFNPASQFVWSSDQFKQYESKLANLAAEGMKINSRTDFAGQSNFWLQQYKTLGGENLFASASSDRIAGIAKYPDGQVWTVDGNVTLDSTSPITINNKGTIIIRGGNLTVNAGVDLVNSTSNPGRLGIVVMKDPVTGIGGNCTFKGNNHINAMVMCEATLSTQGNVDMTGSFVAKQFNINQTFSAFFQYDPIFDDNQPPGFRDLNLSRTTEIGNR